MLKWSLLPDTCGSREEPVVGHVCVYMQTHTYACANGLREAESWATSPLFHLTHAHSQRRPPDPFILHFIRLQLMV